MNAAQPASSPTGFNHAWHGWRVTLPLWLLLLALAAGLRLWRLDQLPPGLFYDEAFNGLDARAILDGTAWPLYFAANNGREPIFIYLQAIFVYLLGPTPYALRLCAAVVGTLTVPLCYWAAATILRSPDQQGAATGERPVNWLALVVATALAVSYWHVSLSRLGFRVNLLPPFSALAFVLFWRAWQSGQRREYAWAGLALAVNFYTYTAARLLPLVIIAFLLIVGGTTLWQQRRDRQGWWRRGQPVRQGLGLMILTGLVGALPFFYTVYQDPTIIRSRTDDISIFTVAQKDMPGTIPERLWGNLTKTALSFYTQGDANPRHNLPLRPFLDWPLALLFTLGWLRALWQLHDRRMQFVLLWFGVMLTPTLFSMEAPHTLRMAGALPPLVLLIGLGAQSFYQATARFLRRPAMGATLIVLALGLSTVWTVRDYFGRWATQRALGAAFDTDLQLAAERVEERLPAIAQGEGLLLSRRLYLAPQMRYRIGTLPRRDLAAGESVPHSGRVEFLREESVDPEQLAFLLYATTDGVQVTWLDGDGNRAEPRLLEELGEYEHQELVSPIHQPGWPLLWAGQVDDNALPLVGKRIPYPLDVTFANGMRLVGYQITPNPVGIYASKPTLLLTTYWQRPPGMSQQSAESFDLFGHLLFNGQLFQVNGLLGGSYRLSLWEPEQPFDDRRLFTLPEAEATGKAYFEIGLYARGQEAIQRINILDGNGNVAADQVVLGATWIGDPPPPLALASLAGLHVHFAEQIELVGWQWTKGTDGLEVTLHWRALDRMSSPYTTFVHLLDAQGQILSQNDQPPGGVENPTSLWYPGEETVTVHRLPIEPTFDLGQTTLRIGLYEPVSGLQLPISAADDPAVAPNGATYLLLKLN